MTESIMVAPAGRHRHLSVRIQVAVFSDQGRRWGGGDGMDGEDYPGANDIYEAASTFESYGVPYGVDAGARSRLSAAVPASHKAFLRDLLWVHEQQLDFAPGSLVAVHAGLLATKPLAPQMDALRRRDAAAKVIQENEIGRFEALSGRKEVERMHPDLDGLALLVSGHHGKVSIHGDRFSVDPYGLKVEQLCCALRALEGAYVSVERDSAMRTRKGGEESEGTHRSKNAVIVGRRKNDRGSRS